MAEDTDTTVATDTTVTTTASTTTEGVEEKSLPGAFVNPDGTFKEGWRDLIPEDVRGRKVFDMATDLPSILKQLGNADALIGRQGKGVMVPTDKSTQTERDMFYEAIGRPKTPADYKIEPPKGLEDFYDTPLVQEAREDMHRGGFTQKQVDIVMALDAKRIAQGVKENEEAQVAEREEVERALREKWGEAFDERLGIANRMIEENVSAEAKESILAIIGNNPHVADLLATIGKKFMEDTVIHHDGTGTALTPEECLSRAKQLMETPGYAVGTLPEATRNRLQKEIDDLYRKAGAVSQRA